MKRLLSCALGLFAPFCAIQAAPQYEITTFNALGGFSDTWVSAGGINNSGQVVGSGQLLSSGLIVPFLYENGVLTLLSSTATSDYNTVAISDNGQIGGQIDGEASIYAGEGVWTSLDSGLSFFYGINNSGNAVGEALLEGNDDFRAVLFSGGNVTDLGTLGGLSSDARAINNAGQIVGTSSVSQCGCFCQAFIYENGVMTGLGGLDGTGDSEGFAINDLGQVVGASRNANDDYHAFLWHDGVMMDLGSLEGLETGYSEAYGINNLGHVVGTSFDASDYENAFLYDGIQMWNLKDLVVNFEASGMDYFRLAYDINDQGQIIGLGFDLEGNSVGFLLTPVPEPSTMMLLFGVAAGALLLRHTRRA